MKKMLSALLALFCVFSLSAAAENAEVKGSGGAGPGKSVAVVGGMWPVPALLAV